MTILPKHHRLLTTRLEPLEEIDERVRQDAHNMLLLCNAKNGLGLAANQVGVTYRMFVIPSLAEPVCINPIILHGKRVVKVIEGCLSLPEYLATVLRKDSIRVEYYNLDGELININLQGQEAHVFQHELSHLNGVLINMINVE